MTRLLVLFLMLLVNATDVLAEEVWIRNKPFQGAVSKAGGELQLELKPLAKALDLELTEENGGWAAGPAGQAPDGTIASGCVLVGGQAIPVVQGTNGPMVALKPFAAAAGAKLSRNKDLGTLDVYLPERSSGPTGDWVTTSTDAGASSGGGAGWQSFENAQKFYSIRYPSSVELISDKSLMQAAMDQAGRNNPQDAPYLQLVNAEFIVLGKDGASRGVLVALVIEPNFAITSQAEDQMIAGMAARAAETGGSSLGKPTVVSLGGVPFKSASFRMVRDGQPMKMVAFLHLSATHKLGYMLMVVDSEKTFAQGASALLQTARAFRVH